MAVYVACSNCNKPHLVLDAEAQLRVACPACRGVRTAPLAPGPPPHARTGAAGRRDAPRTRETESAPVWPLVLWATTTFAAVAGILVTIIFVIASAIQDPVATASGSPQASGQTPPVQPNPTVGQQPNNSLPPNHPVNPNPLPPNNPVNPNPPAPAGGGLRPPATPPDPTVLANLVGYWAFEDENPSALAADGSPFKNSGRAVGAKFVAGIRGQALFLDGVNTHFDYGAGTILNFSANSPFTITLWVKTDAASGPILSQRNSKDDGAVIDLLLNKGRIQGELRHDKGFFVLRIKTNHTINDNQWHHCALVRDGSEAFLYVDGAMIGKASGKHANGPITTDLRALCLEQRWGKHGFGGIPGTLAAAVDELCIFQRALTEQEIQTLAGRGQR